MKCYFYIFFALLIISGCESPKEKFSNQIGMNFVYIKPGSFMMGPKNQFISQYLKHPQHKVTLTKGFYIQTTETTVGQWRVFIEQTGFKTQAEKNGYGFLRHGKHFPLGFSVDRIAKGLYWDKPGYKKTEKHPVTQISWNDIQVFIKWINSNYGNYYRLPTEAEWEYVCRSGSNTHFYFGNMTKEEKNLKHIENKKLNDIAWYEENSKGFPHQVGLKKQNPWGVFDMYGNVEEACIDFFVYSFSKDNLINPINKISEDEMNKNDKVVRGGGWNAIVATMTSSTRGRLGINDYSDLNGFRLVKEVSQEDYK